MGTDSTVLPKGPAPRPGVAEQDPAERIAASAGELPALPQVATKVMQLIYEPRTTPRKLEEVLLSDPALTSKVLRIANSAFFGVRGNVSTLGRAIMILGFNTLRSVVLASVSEGLHRGKRSCFKDRILWEHSMAVALAARTIAKECHYLDLEEAYVAGLLHDIGKTVFDANRPQEYQQVLERVYNEGQTFLTAEREVFGFDHTDVGALVIRRWGLTDRLHEAVLFHHDPLGATIDPMCCAIVSLANRICVKLGIGPERNPELELIDPASPLGLAPEQIDGIAVLVQERLAEEKARMGVE